MEFIFTTKRMRNLLILCFAYCFLSTIAYAAQQPSPIVCTQEYALCTSAPCIPDPRHPGYAMCSCVVKQGDSAGYKSCKDRIPKKFPDNTIRVISTFSFAQFDSKKAMSCARGMPWTNCVDAPCTVNPMNHDQAICSCPIKHEEEFFTFGGDCKTKTCATGFWSGATDSSAIVFRNAMFKKLNITKNPWPNAACAITDK
jgi:hypothetical protein